MDEIGLTEYFEMLGRRKKTIAAVTLIAVLIGFIMIVMTPRTYRGRVTILFPQRQESGASGLLSQLAGMPSIGGLSVPSMAGPAMYTEILKSRTLADQVVRNLGLERARVDAESLSGQIEVDTSKDGSLKIACYAPSTWVVKGGLNRLPGENVERRTARLAAQVANAYVAELQDFDRRHSLTSGRHNRVFLEGEVAKTKAQLAKSEESLRAFIAAHPTVPPPDATSEQVKEVIGLRSNQIQAETELKEAGRSVEEARGVVADQQVVESISKVMEENPVVTELRKQLAGAEVARAQLLENFTEKHPDVVAIDQEVEKTREKIGQEVAKVTASETLGVNPVRQALVENLALLEVKRSGLQARVDAMNDVMKRVERNISELAGDEMRYVRLLRDVKALEMVYTSLLTQLSNAKVSESRDPEGFTVLDDAIPEKSHFKPKTKMVLLAAMILGLMAGSFLAIVQESRTAGKRKR